jgi:hypothetical protein
MRWPEKLNTFLNYLELPYTNVDNAVAISFMTPFRTSTTGRPI